MKLILFFISALTILPLAINNAYGQDLEKAVLLIDYQQHKKAAAAIEGAVDNPKRNFYKGYLQLRKGNTTEATTILNDYAENNPKEGLAYSGLGYLDLMNNRVEAAEENFKKALQYGKKDPDVYALIAEAYLEHNTSLPQALSSIEQAIELNQSNIRYHIIKGDIHLALNDGGKAISGYEDASLIASTNGIPYHKIGNVYIRSKNIARAEEAFLKSIAADKEYAPVYKDLAELLFDKKEIKEARNNYEQYLTIAEKVTNAVKGRFGYICYLNKDYQKAADIFQEILAAENDNLLINKYLAYALSELDQSDVALAAFKEYFTITTEADQDWKDYEVYGKLLLKNNNTTDGINALKKASVLNPGSVELVQLIAETTFRQKDYTSSTEFYGKLIGLRKAPYPQDYYILGRSYFNMEDYAQADSIFSMLVSLQPQSHIAHLWKGRAQANLDPETEQGLAKSSYEKVIELVPAGETKYNNDLKEAHSYLGYYYYLKQDFTNSAVQWKKVQLIDPADERAKEALKSLM